MGQQFEVQFDRGDGGGVSDGGRALFSSRNGAVFSAIQHRIGQIICQSRAL
jgi:hypothetical protein